MAFGVSSFAGFQGSNPPKSMIRRGTDGLSALPMGQFIASSSIASWLDSDANRAQDIGEPKGPFPVIARERLGQGSIILLSDPSVLINGMREQLDNAVLADNLLLEVGELFFEPLGAVELSVDGGAVAG